MQVLCGLFVHALISAELELCLVGIQRGMRFSIGDCVVKGGHPRKDPDGLQHLGQEAHYPVS